MHLVALDITPKPQKGPCTSYALLAALLPERRRGTSHLKQKRCRTTKFRSSRNTLRNAVVGLER